MKGKKRKPEEACQNLLRREEGTHIILKFGIYFFIHIKNLAYATFFFFFFSVGARVGLQIGKIIVKRK